MKRLATTISIVLLITCTAALYGCGSNSSDEGQNGQPVLVKTPEMKSAKAVSPTDILCKFETVPGAAYYQVYRNDVVTDETTTVDFYIDDELTPGRTYAYRVRAFVDENIYSQLSDTIYATTPLPSAPNPPVLLGASQSKVSVTWNAIDDADGYNIYRDGSFLSRASATSTAFHDTELSPSKEYCYTVSVVIHYVESAQSAKVCVTTLPNYDIMSPHVLSTTPADGETGVQTNLMAITATFTEGMNMLSVVTADAFTVMGPKGIVAGTKGYNSTTNTVAFFPIAALESSAMYTVTISGDVFDAAGVRRMGTPYIWSFMTN
jgi:Big-like domain-containing protein